MKILLLLLLSGLGIRAFVAPGSPLSDSSSELKYGKTTSSDESSFPYIDHLGGTVEYECAPWQVLNFWLSELNGNVHVNNTLCKGVTREKTIEELASRLDHDDCGAMACNMGYGFDWREHENKQGYTHLEELLIYQPKGWRKQAREYIYRFEWDLERKSPARNKMRIIERLYTGEDGSVQKITFPMSSPALVVLFHPDMSRTSRYEALNFLLAYAYGSENPLAVLFEYGRLTR